MMNRLYDPAIGDPIFEVDDHFVKGVDHVQSPFRYPGGKYYALKYIIPMLNCVPHEEYREPFAGGGSVFFGKPKSQVNWINDLESDLIEVYRAIQCGNRLATLIAKVESEIATPERHKEVKEFAPSNADEIAFRTFYLNRTSYSGIINKPAWGYKIGQSAPPENWPKHLRNAHHKLRNCKITDVDFEKVILEKSKSRVLLYLDPPYYLADQRRAYTKPFEALDHTRLAKALKRTDHYFCLSYDDCEEVRRLYPWANIYERTWFYNTANTKGSRSLGRELLITNYRVDHKTQLELI